MDEQYGSDKTLERYILGTAGLGGVWRPVDPRESVKAIIYALQSGITQIDTAPAYGDAESFVGEAIREWKAETKTKRKREGEAEGEGESKRFRPQLSTKVGRLKGYASDRGNYDYSHGRMEKSLENSLSTLGVNCIDTLFLHEPAAIPSGEIQQAVKAMVRFKEQGYAKKVGLGGNYPPAFKGFIEDGIFDTVMEYNRLNGCHLDALETSLLLCVKQGVDFWAASPLHMGLLGSQFAKFVAQKPDWLPSKDIATACRVKLLADKWGFSLPELAFQFIKKIPQPFKIVIGASNQTELDNTLGYIKAPPLKEPLYRQMFGALQNKY
ncbi:aldo/keto reductase [Arachidicoccus ginsenosidivorans]|uniref:Aldo/keto reductase n=1 Tax=Arachidicoccus ginsenosidivorans TaxID=496057 RepID=A0A5B8VSU0_9BACT|nr:aldo/keto reductase [Arachidicoccus ginsenosidivorans]QEC73826.1 aldo/keto reductase [Arachidicoccus ginsenosidivorans]